MIYVGKRICTSSLFDEHPVSMQNTFYVSNTGKTYLPLFLHVFVIGIQYLCKILNTFYISNTGKTNSHVFVISIQYLCTASFSRLVTLALFLAQLRQHCSCMRTIRRGNLSNLLVWRKGNLSNFPTTRMTKQNCSKVDSQLQTKKLVAGVLEAKREKNWSGNHCESWRRAISISRMGPLLLPH